MTLVPRYRRVILLAIVLGGGFFIWRTGALGVFPTERTIVWRFPVSYAEVRRLELQVWDGDELVKAQEQAYPAGLVGEPHLQVPLASGRHRAIASVWLTSAGPTGFQLEFDPGSDETVVVEMKRP